MTTWRNVSRLGTIETQERPTGLRRITYPSPTPNSNDTDHTIDAGDAQLRPLPLTDADFDAVADRFVAACRAMQRDGWWWIADPADNRKIKRRILWEMLTLGARKMRRP